MTTACSMARVAKNFIDKKAKTGPRVTRSPRIAIRQSRNRTQKMNITLDQAQGARKPYVAEVQGPDKEYELARKFLKGRSKDVRRRRITRWTFQIGGAIYEVQPSNDLRYYVAVTRTNRKVALNRKDVGHVTRMCQQYDVDFAQLAADWLVTRNKTSQSLVKLTNERVAPMRREVKLAKKQAAEARRNRVARMSAAQAFATNNGADTTAYTRRLLKADNVAAALFRAQKSSANAKTYSRENRERTYDRKRDALGQLCGALKSSSLTWGWKEDPDESYAHWVLYVDLPNGQVSFHSPSRTQGPDYSGDWDGMHESRVRILEYCDKILDAQRERTDQGSKG